MAIMCTDFVPKYCSSCGKLILKNREQMSEFISKVTYVCSACGLVYQLMETNSLVEAARKDGGDLRDLGLAVK